MAEMFFEDLGYGRLPPDRWFSQIHKDKRLFMEQLRTQWDSEFVEIARTYGVLPSSPDEASAEDFEAFVNALVRALALRQDEDSPPEWEIHLQQKYQRGNH